MSDDRDYDSAGEMAIDALLERAEAAEARAEAAEGHARTCNRLGLTPGYLPCRRAVGHSGPCAHEIRVDLSTRPRIVAGNLTVVAAAARIRFEGALVHDQARELILSVPQPGRHHNVMYLAGRAGFDTFSRECEQGFLLSDGSFATRELALAVASAAGQIIHRCGGDHYALYSENLW